MARQIIYVFKKEEKVINFSYDKFRDIYEAVAAAEGIDLTRFLAIEEQVRTTAKDKSAIKNYREKEFASMGFGRIQFLKLDE